jgi:hypothetical protein
MRRDDMLAQLLAELEELDEATEHLRVIAVCEAIAALVPRQEDPHGWAGMMLMIAGALVRNPAHDPAGDIRRAIGCCEAAREVYRRAAGDPRPRGRGTPPHYCLGAR